MISKLRQYWAKTKNQWLWFLGGVCAGWFISPTAFSWLLNRAEKIPPRLLGALFVISAAFVVILGILVLFLRDDLDRHKKYLSKQKPGFNIDDEEEYDRGWADE